MQPFSGYGEEEQEEQHGDKHQQLHRVDIRDYLAGVELGGEKARPAEEHPERAPYLAVELVNVLKILPEIFPERLLHIQRVLSAAVAVHSLQFRSAVLAVSV